MNAFRLSQCGRSSLCRWWPVAALTIRRGSLIDTPATGGHPERRAIDRGHRRQQRQALSGRPKCDVKVVALNYNTVGARATTAPTPRA